MYNSLIVALKALGTTAIAQLSGPKAWAASFVLKIVIFVLDYFKVKHELKLQFEEKLKAYEAVKPDATEKEKDEALDNFLK